MVGTFVIVLFLFLSLQYLLNILKSNKLNLPPSPPKLPIIGNIHQIGRFHPRYLQSLPAKYGPVMLVHVGQVPMLLISSADAVREILKFQDVAFSGKPHSRAGDAFFYGRTDIAFGPYNEYWRQLKKISVVELLSQKRVQEFEFVREEEVAKIIEKIRVACRDGVAVDLSEVALSVTSKIVSRSALGRACEGDDGDKSLERMARKAIDLLSAFSFMECFPSLGWMDNFTGLVASLKDTSKALDDALEQVIEEHATSMKDDKSDKKDIVDILLGLQKNGMRDINLSRDNIKAILMDMYIGGTDTTASLMEWAMAELAKNPNAMKKAQEEVRRVVANKSKICETDINNMTYIKCILKETIRLHAPATISRETISSVKLQGYDIPPKTRVLINSFAIRRDPKIWEKPDEFIPERFADMTIDYKDQSGKFIPFGCGRRTCPGISFALTGAEFVLANLLYWFNWSLLPGQTVEDMDMTEATSGRMEKPLLVVPTMYCP